MANMSDYDLVSDGYYPTCDKNYYELYKYVQPTPVDFDDGIKETVKFLNENGFRTTDSGDGSKINMECALLVSNVHILVEPDSAIAESNRLLSILRTMTTVGPSNIQLTYDPVDQYCILSIYNINDKRLGLKVE